MTLRSRFNVGLFTLLAAGLVLPSILLYLLARDRVRGDVDQFVSDKALLLASRINPQAPEAIQFVERDWSFDRFTPYGQTFDPGWNPLFVSKRLPAPIPVDDSVRRGAAHPLGRYLHSAVGVDGTRYRMATVTVTRNGEHLGFVQIGVREEEWNAPLRSLLATLVVGNAVALGLAWAGIRFLSEHWRLSLAGLGGTAQEISTQGLSRHRFVAPADDPELSGIAAAFNRLLDRLAQTREQQQQFVADASHELRTPLTVLRGELEVALRKERSAPEYRETLEACRQEVERLSRLVDNLLVLAQVDAGTRTPPSGIADLGTVCRAVAERLTPWATESGVTLEVTATDSVPVRGDAFALERVMTNLVENAVRFSARGEAVEIRARSDGSDAMATVTDHGPGIPDEDLGRIFERFHRVEAARSRQRGGAGLGLAIVKSLVESHGGTVSVQSRLGQGSTFTVRLPLAPTDPPAPAR